MFDLFLSFLTGVGALVSGLLVITTLFLIFRKLKKRRIPKGVVLTLDLDQGIVEVPPTSPAAKLKNKHNIESIHKYKAPILQARTSLINLLTNFLLPKTLKSS